jgi:DNA invertase Pin-like site-specific DNA recombinase
MLIGYARVSTNEQDTTAQASALKTAGCERIFREKAAGGRWNRPELQRLLDHLRKGDVLVIWKLDGLSRSLRDVLTIMERIQEAKAGFSSLTEAIDTTTPAGRMMMQMIGSFAEFERAMLRERTRAGLESARDEGRIGGRRPKLLPQAADRGSEDGRSRYEDCSGCCSTLQCPSRDDLPTACAGSRAAQKH